MAEVACDGVDQDCDGEDDLDCDGDGYVESDCDQTDPAINFEGADVCGDGVDQDCDGHDLACPPPSDCYTPGCTFGGSAVFLPLLIVPWRRRPRA